MNSKGIALMLVISIILTAATLGGVLVNGLVSQARLTHHQVTRTQAIYAAQAGVVVALERLRTGDWTPGVNCTQASPCPLQDPDFPDPPIANNTVYIVITPGSTPGTATISVSADYTY